MNPTHAATDKPDGGGGGADEDGEHVAVGMSMVECDGLIGLCDVFVLD